MRFDLDRITSYDFLEMAVNSEDGCSSLEDAINWAAALKRNIYIADITDEVGEYVEGIIRFWNNYDDEMGIEPEKREPIKIYVDSPGGSLLATFTMIDAIELSKTPVWTINIGTAYSGGFLLFIAGHKRLTYKRSSFLFHEGSTGQISDAGKFRNYAEFYERLLKRLKDVVLEYTKISEDLYTEKQRDDWWLTAEEAIELGIADEIVKEFV